MIEPMQSDGALLADLAGAPRNAGRLDVWWLAQSGYVVQCAARRVVFDPYLSETLTRKYAGTEKPHMRISRQVVEPGLLTGVDFVTSTHAHTDHLDGATLNPILAANPQAKLVYARSTQPQVHERVTQPPHRFVPLAVGERYTDGVTFDAVPAAHQPPGRDANGDDHCIGLIVTIGRFRIYHSGDTVVYDGLAETVRALGAVDIAILPINGKVGNMNGTDAARLAKAIGAAVVIPCHYDLFAFNTADPADQFVPECERLAQPFKVLRLGERLTIQH